MGAKLSVDLALRRRFRCGEHVAKLCVKRLGKITVKAPARNDKVLALSLSLSVIPDAVLCQDHVEQAYDRTLADIERALEAAGLQFIPENGGGAGVRFRERKAP